MTIALYPGSFDPVTNGHLDIVKRVSRIFDAVVIAVFDRPNKNLLFSTVERLELLREATSDMPQVQVATYSVLTVAYAREIGASAIVRGLRATNDFEHEFQMAQVNQTIDPTIDYIGFMASRRYTFLSSSTVREITALGGDVSELVPEHVAAALHQKYARKS